MELKEKIVADKKEIANYATKSVDFALKTHQALTIKHKVSKSVPKRHREGHKGSAVLKFYSENSQTSAYEQPKHHE